MKLKGAEQVSAVGEDPLLRESWVENERISFPTCQFRVFIFDILKLFLSPNVYMIYAPLQ